MKVAQLLITVLVSGVAIFVYDTMRGSEAPPRDVAAPLVVESPPPAPTRESTRPPPVVLPGSTVTQAQVDALKARIVELETQVNRALQAGRTSEEPRTNTPAWHVPDVGDPSQPTFTEQDLASFRALYEESRRREQRERIQQSLANQLERVGVNLTVEERDAVIAETLATQAKALEARQNSPAGPHTDATLLTRLQAEYAERVYSIVRDAQEAEKVVNALGRYAGVGGGGRAQEFRGRGSRFPEK